MKWKRMAINVMGMLVILGGGLSLTSASAAAGPVVVFDRCETDDGGVCEGDTCCSNGDMCSTSEDICREMMDDDEEESETA